tara:strand:+ start:30 stop:293 length:264 start_codon:yes stop_codon:yes gene_type:complete
MKYTFPIVLTKPKGRQIIVFDADPHMNEGKDDWFVRVSYRKSNTHKETSHSIIVKKDIKNWMRSMVNEREGYIIQENFKLKETIIPE